MRIESKKKTKEEVVNSKGHSQLMFTEYTGNLDYTDYSYYNYRGHTLGLRPIVCLKPSVSLEAQGDGMYAIVQ